MAGALTTWFGKELTFAIPWLVLAVTGLWIVYTTRILQQDGQAVRFRVELPAELRPDFAGHQSGVPQEEVTPVETHCSWLTLTGVSRSLTA
jgi:hypothetical protein